MIQHHAIDCKFRRSMDDADGALNEVLMCGAQRVC